MERTRRMGVQGSRAESPRIANSERMPSDLGPWDRIARCKFEVPPRRYGLNVEKQKVLVNASKLLNVAAYCVIEACRIRKSRTTELTYGDQLALRSTQTRNMPGGEAAGETNARRTSSHQLKVRHSKGKT